MSELLILNEDLEARSFSERQQGKKWIYELSIDYKETVKKFKLEYEVKPSMKKIALDVSEKFK